MLTPAEVATQLLPQPRAVWVQRPSIARATDCLIILDAGLYIDRVRAPEIIEALQIDGGLAHVDCIYVSAIDGAARHIELTCNADFASFLATDLHAWIERHVGPHQRYGLCGLSLSGLQALFTAIEYPQRFCGAIAQSPSAWWNDEWLARVLGEREVTTGQFWISVGDQETTENVAHPPTGLLQATSQLASCRRLNDTLNHAGAKVHYGEYAGGHDPNCWAAELPTALRWLLPSPG